MEYIWRYYEFIPLKGHLSKVCQACDSDGNYPEIKVEIDVYAKTHEESINKAKEIAKQLNK